MLGMVEPLLIRKIRGGGTLGKVILTAFLLGMEKGRRSEVEEEWEVCRLDDATLAARLKLDLGLMANSPNRTYSQRSSFQTKI